MTLTEAQKMAIKKYRQGNGRVKVNQGEKNRYSKTAIRPLKTEFKRLGSINIS